MKRRWKLLMLHLIKKIIKKALMDGFYLFPVQRKVVFINFNGRGFGCNPKYIALEMIQENINADLVWLVNDITLSMPDEIRKVRWGSVSYFYELATAKIIITNVKNQLPFHKKKNQKLIQTWHGSNPYKYVEAETIETLSATYINESKKNSLITDIFISDGSKTSSWYRKSFWCNCEILESGMPRDDILTNGTLKQKQEIRMQFQLDMDKKIILYAPTFRDDKSLEGYTLNFENVIDSFQKKFGGDWRILLRLHPNAIMHLVVPSKLKGKIIDVSTYPDAQELIFASDALITDYSSICNDFLAMNKPVFLYVPDLDNYIHNNRKLKKSYFDLPIRKNKSDASLIWSIMNFNYDIYEENINEYKKEYFGIHDGYASKRVVSKIATLLDE